MRTLWLAIDTLQSSTLEEFVTAELVSVRQELAILRKVCWIPAASTKSKLPWVVSPRRCLYGLPERVLVVLGCGPAPSKAPINIKNCKLVGLVGVEDPYPPTGVWETFSGSLLIATRSVGTMELEGRRICWKSSYSRFRGTFEL